MRGCRLFEFQTERLSLRLILDRVPAGNRACRHEKPAENPVLSESVGGHSLLSELHSLGIDLALHQQGIDTTTPAGKAMFK